MKFRAGDRVRFIDPGPLAVGVFIVQQDEAPTSNSVAIRRENAPELQHFWIAEDALELAVDTSDIWSQYL